MAAMMLTMCSQVSVAHRRPMRPLQRSVCRGPFLRNQHTQPQQFKEFGRERQVVVHAVNEFGTGMSEELKASLDQFIKEHKVILFMKGSKDFPQCGFSNTCVQILNMMEVPYETVNILESDVLREGMKVYSQWPTFPQAYIDGEFFGGCDIMTEAYQSGELKETLEKAMNA